MQFWALVVDGFRESLDRKIFWVVAGLILVVVVGAASIDFEPNRVTFLFGATAVETDGFNPATADGRAAIMAAVVFLVMDVTVGWIGVLLMIVATASFFPTMIESGTIDVMLSKPIGRPRLFLYKYVASLVFVVLQAALFVGSMFLVMGFHWGVWAPGFLWAVPLLVLLFSYVYCVSVLVGVMMRSTVAAILISIFAWVLYTAPATALEVVETMPGFKDHRLVYNCAKIAAWVPPKTSDIAYIASQLARGGTIHDVFDYSEQPELDKEQVALSVEYEKKKLHMNPYTSIGSSLAFEAVVLVLAMVRFCRRDF